MFKKGDLVKSKYKKLLTYNKVYEIVDIAQKHIQVLNDSGELEWFNIHWDMGKGSWSDLMFQYDIEANRDKKLKQLIG